MRDEPVLFVCQTRPGVPGCARYGLDFAPGSDLEALYIRPLRTVCSRVVVYDMADDYPRLGVRRANRKLLTLARRIRPRYVVWHTNMYELLDETLDALRAEGIVVVGWFSDDEVRFGNYSRLWTAHLDYCLTADRNAPARYADAGARGLLFMWGSNPQLFKPSSLPPSHDVTFVGRRFGDRGRFISGLAERGIDVETFGHGWASGYVSTTDLAALYSTSRINLCFVESYGQGTPPQIKGRIFDVCMSGGLLLCEYVPGLEDYFEIGTEVACFASVDEAAEKIRSLLTHDDERAAMALAGLARARSQHTQALRWQAVLSELDALEAQKSTGASSASSPLAAPHECRARACRFHLAWAKHLATAGSADCLWMDELEIASSYDPDDREVRRLLGVARLRRPYRRAAVLATIRAADARRATGGRLLSWRPPVAPHPTRH